MHDLSLLTSWSRHQSLTIAFECTSAPSRQGRNAAILHEFTAVTLFPKMPHPHPPTPSHSDAHSWQPFAKVTFQCIKKKPSASTKCTSGLPWPAGSTFINFNKSNNQTRIRLPMCVCVCATVGPPWHGSNKESNLLIHTGYLSGQEMNPSSRYTVPLANTFTTALFKRASGRRTPVAHLPDN